MVLLSVNGAKLVALILNALYGILEFAEEHADRQQKSSDLLFGIRIVQGELGRLASRATPRAFPPDLVEVLTNLSTAAGFTADSLDVSVRASEPLQYDRLKSLLSSPYAFSDSPQRLVDPRLVWKTRTTISSNLTDEQSERCIAELFVSDGSCRPSRSCLEAMATTKHLANYALSKQIIYLTLASRRKLCRRSLLAFLDQNRARLEALFLELCTNTLHEMDLFLSRASSNLDTLTPLQKDLLMQHIFVCGQHGFIDVARPRLLWMILRHQRMADGCFVLAAGHSPPDIGRHLLMVNGEKDGAEACSAHSTATAAGALSALLGFVLEPSDWAEIKLIDSAFSFASPHKSTPTKGRFAKFDWRSWTASRPGSNNAFALGLGEPPPLSMHARADAVAFVALILGVVAFMLCVNFYCGRGGSKQFYGYAYKKL